MSNIIYPLAYKLSPKQTCTLYYLGFPASWKKALLDIARRNKPNFNDEYGLPTNTLKKLVNSWMEGIADLSVLRARSDDEHWLTSYYEYSEKSIKTLCGIIKAWINATYITSPKVTPAVKELARKFRNSMRWQDLAATQSSEEICLTNEDGTVNDYAYQVIPLIAVNRLLSKEIELNGEILHFCYAASNQLISKPITDIRSHHQYSFVFDFSVQTTPPKRKALLLCHMSIRRWIPDRNNKEKVPYLENAVNVHIKIPGEDKYCQVPIDYVKRLDFKGLDWKAQDKECYDIWARENLPLAEDLMKDPVAYADKYLLPYKNGMGGFVEPKIGTGVSALDKVTLCDSIFDLLGDMVCEKSKAERITRQTGQMNLKHYESPQDYDNSEDFRCWVSKCAETDKITFELYGLWKDGSQRQLLEKIEEKIKLDFGEEKDASCLKVNLVHKEVGSFADEISDEGKTMKSAKIDRRNEIVEHLEKTDTVTACIFILPGKEDYGKGDPKSVIRNAFAETGRVIQFVTPSSGSDQNESEKNKIENAVYDLYRQLGVVTLLKINEKQPDLVQVPCVGMHICTQVQGRTMGKNKSRFIPLYVMVNLKEGKTRVQCDAFSKRTVSYRQACLEMAKLFWKSDLEALGKKASDTPAKKELIELKNYYDNTESSVLMLVQADGNTRALWSGIADKEISDYSLTDKYCPSKINVGKSKSKIHLTLANSGVRIIRVRSNQEVPDYYTEHSDKATDEKEQRTAVSGVFKYEDVYWSIHAKPNDPRYNMSYKESKITSPEKSFAEKDMIELYPLQLQSGDDADRWIHFAKALGDISIQYNRPTILPLPLHLAKCLEEYLFEP